MASRTPRAGSSRRHSAEGLAITDRDTNNRRLAQAISYLRSEGGSDSDTEYRERVQKIDDCVVEQYLHEGYSFDPNLWRELQAMVQEVQSSLRHADERGVHVDEFSAEDDDDVEGVPRLYRAPTMTEIELDAAHAEYGASRFGSGAGAPASRPSARPERPAGSQVDLPAIAFTGIRAFPPLEQANQPELLQRVFEYGGPNNEPEEWLKNFPPSLPFGETLHMQQLESLMIDYDLGKSAENLANGNSDPIVETDVKYEDARLEYAGQYDSGSKFKLPQTSARVRNLVDKQVLSLTTVLVDFNLGGGEAAQIRRDYAPRIFLERVYARPSYDEGDSTRIPTVPHRASTLASAPGSSQPRRLFVSQTGINRRPTSSDGRRDPVTPPSSSKRPIARRASSVSNHIRDQNFSKVNFRGISDFKRNAVPSSSRSNVPLRRYSGPVGTSRKRDHSTDAGPSPKTNVPRRPSTAEKPRPKAPQSTLGKRKLSIASDGYDAQFSKKRRPVSSLPARSPRARAAKGVKFAKRITSIGSEDIVIRPSAGANRVAVTESHASKPNAKPAATNSDSGPAMVEKAPTTAKVKPRPQSKVPSPINKATEASAPKVTPVSKRVEWKAKLAVKKAASEPQQSHPNTNSTIVKPVFCRKAASKRFSPAKRKTSIEKALSDTEEYVQSPTFLRHVTRSNKKFGR